MNTLIPMQIGQLRCRGRLGAGTRQAFMDFYDAATGKVLTTREMVEAEYDEWEDDGFPEDIPIGVEMTTDDGPER